MLHIVKDTQPSLRVRCVPVDTPLSEENQALIDEMLEYLLLSQDENYRKKHPQCREGVGLAAPQVGHNVRMIVISYETGDEKNPRVQYQLANPRIIRSSVKKCYIPGGEGCLSVDGVHNGRVYRDYKIVVEAYEAKLRSNVTITAKGYDAIVLQHEIDHLNGILFYDHIDPKDPNKDIPGAVAV
ncbi:MAG: peptide deformylase [Bacilli bacterium]|nr:peptide deformylase [Bacilli bacterium]